MTARLTVLRGAVGLIVGIGLLPRHAGATHIEALKNAAAQFGIDIEAKPALKHELQQVDASARIGKTCTRIEVQMHPPVRFERWQVG